MSWNTKKNNHEMVKTRACLNCESPLRGNENYCANCGQQTTVSRLTFKLFVSNLLAGFFSYDSRFWQTFIPLLTKPGKVAKQYIEGKRVRFVNPFQLYLNVSIIFFLLLGVSQMMKPLKSPTSDLIHVTENLDSISNIKNKDSILKTLNNQVHFNDSIKPDDIEKIKAFVEVVGNENKGNPNYKYHIQFANKDSITFLNKLEDFYQFNKRFPKLKNEISLDSLGYKKSYTNKLYYQMVSKSVSNIKMLNTDNGVRDLMNKITSYTSISLFIFLPIFTLFFKLLYIRRPFTYMEHLVFVFNTQTVFFLLFLIYYLLDIFVKIDSIWWVFICLFLIYLYKAMRNFYGQNRFKTIIKFMMLSNCYLILGLVGFIIVAMISIVFA